MNRSFEMCAIEKLDFEMKIQQPELFAKSTNDNYLFLFLEIGFNAMCKENEGLWIIPRLHRNEFRKVKTRKLRL